jgi:probable O-glycosylation ligase (exosortase A-associated)
MRDLAFFIALIGLMPASLRFPHVGIMLWVWTALLGPQQFFYGFLQSVPLNKLAAAATFVAMFVQREKRRFYIDTHGVLLIALLLVSTLSSVISISSQELTWTLFDKIYKMIVLAFMIPYLMRSRLRLHTLALTVALALGFLGADEGLKFLASGGGHHVLGVGTIGDNNSFAVAMLMSIPFMYYCSRYSVLKLLRFGWLGTIVLTLFSVIGTFSRGGFVGMLVMALSFIGTSKRKVLNFALLIVLGIVLAQFAPSSYSDRMHSIDDASSDDSFMGRVLAWKISTLIALDRPLFGGGFHAVQIPSVWAGYGSRFATLSFIPTPDAGEIPHAAHSIYFEVLGDLGFTGLFIFLGLLWCGWRNAGVVRRLTKGKADLAWAYELASMSRLSVLVYAVSGAALSMAYFEGLYIVLAMISVLRHMAEHELLGEVPKRFANLARPAVPAPVPVPAGALATSRPQAMAAGRTVSGGGALSGSAR